MILGWEEYSHIKPDTTPAPSIIDKELLKEVPLSYHVGFLKRGGLSAYAPLVTIGNLKEGETIFVSVCNKNFLFVFI